MISDGNILRLLFFLFFIFSSCSYIFQSYSANFENKKKRIFFMSFWIYKKELFLKDLAFFLNHVFN